MRERKFISDDFFVWCGRIKNEKIFLFLAYEKLLFSYANCISKWCIFQNDMIMRDAPFIISPHACKLLQQPPILAAVFLCFQ
jgi:hypothetical protein